MSHNKIFIMASGTGGHIFPALAVAEYLHDKGLEVFWLGTKGGMEQRLLPETKFRLFTIHMSGLRGKNFCHWLVMPLKLSIALLQSLILFLREKPDVALGMGGFVSAPGGIAARLIGVPLLIHEQNAVAGTANILLARFASKIMMAFPNTFTSVNKDKLLFTGNPVRSNILHYDNSVETSYSKSNSHINLLVLGGSQGAMKLNHIIPEAIMQLADHTVINVVHQTGEQHVASTREHYDHDLVNVRLVGFVSDMGEVYRWADIVVCRAGAMTITELTVIGIGSILIPFPYAVDDHQTANARYLSDNNAAVLLPEQELTVARLVRALGELVGEKRKLADMGKKARELACLNATEMVSRQCMEYVHV